MLVIIRQSASIAARVASSQSWMKSNNLILCILLSFFTINVCTIYNIHRYTTYTHAIPSYFIFYVFFLLGYVMLMGKCNKKESKEKIYFLFFFSHVPFSYTPTNIYKIYIAVVVVMCIHNPYSSYTYKIRSYFSFT